MRPSAPCHNHNQELTVSHIGKQLSELPILSDARIPSASNHPASSAQPALVIGGRRGPDGRPCLPAAVHGLRSSGICAAWPELRCSRRRSGPLRWRSGRRACRAAGNILIHHHHRPRQHGAGAGRPDRNTCRQQGAGRSSPADHHRGDIVPPARRHLADFIWHIPRGGRHQIRTASSPYRTAQRRRRTDHSVPGQTVFPGWR